MTRLIEAPLKLRSTGFLPLDAGIFLPKRDKASCQVRDRAAGVMHHLESIQYERGSPRYKGAFAAL
jgi:hypothetical protein